MIRAPGEVLMSNVIEKAVQPVTQIGLGSYTTTTAMLSNSKQTAFVQREADQVVATVPGPPPVTASGETIEEATARLESRVNLYA